MNSERAVNRKRVTVNGGAGDTIVEVMISMTVLAVVIGAAYAISTRAFQSSLDSQYRDQAVSYAEQQLELIKDADNNSPATLATYKTTPGTPFCINASSKAKQSVTPGDCPLDSQYTVAVTYCAPATPPPPCAASQAVNSFKVTTSWTSADNRPQQTTLYYKPYDSFANAPVACTPTQTDTCTSTLTNPPKVEVWSDNNPINVGDTDIIHWQSSGVKAGSCGASSNPGTTFGGVDANASPGSYSFSTSNPGNYTFSIDCTDNAGNPQKGQTGVTVNKPAPDVITDPATPSSITYNSATLNGRVNPKGYATDYRFQYGYAANNYAYATNWVSAGAGNSLINVNALVGLSPSTTYHFRLCAANNYQTACGDDLTLTTTAPPPSVISFSAYPTNIAYGGVSTLSWSSANTTGGGCLIGGVAWVGTYGSYNVYPSPPSTSYNLSCYNSTGVWTGTVPAKVSVSDAPSLSSFSAYPTSIAKGGVSTLSWSSANTTGGGCLIDNVAWVGTSGWYNVYPTTSTTYTLHCYNSAGVWTGTLSATVTVLPSIDSFNYKIDYSGYGPTLWLSWSSSNTSYCNFYGWDKWFDRNWQNMPTSSDWLRSVGYYRNSGNSETIVCYNSAGQSASKTVSPQE